MLLHVDEIDHDQACQVAQSELPGDLLGRFEVGSDRCFLDVAFARRAAGIDVDRNQCLGLIDHDIAAGAQLNDRRMNCVDLALDLEAVEKADLGIAIRLDPLGVARHQHLHECLRRAIAFFAFDQDLVDVARIEIADRPLDQVALFINQRGSGRA